MSVCLVLTTPNLYLVENVMNFDFTDFRLFLNIAETKNLTRAAEKTFLSVPAASTRIKNLENLLGLKLLERFSHGVELTEVGLIYLKYGKSIFNEIERLKGDLSLHNKKIQGKLSIVANTTAIAEYIPIALSEYLVSHPNVDVNLRESLSEEIVDLVTDKRADFGIISGDIDTKKLEVMPLVSSKLILIAPKKHPLLKHERVSFLDILEHSIVALHEGSAIHVFLTRLSQQTNKKLSLRVQVSSYDAICQMVAVGAGVGVVPFVTFERLKQIHPNIGYRDIDELWAERSFKVCANDFTELSRFANDFIECLKSHIF